MIVTTTGSIEGRKVARYLGVVAGEAVIGANIVSDFFAKVRDVVGGRAASYEGKLAEAREIAIREMSEQAQSLGAHAVIGVDIDYEVLGAQGSMLMVTACGTAVALE